MWWDKGGRHIIYHKRAVWVGVELYRSHFLQPLLHIFFKFQSQVVIYIFNQFDIRYTSMIYWLGPLVFTNPRHIIQGSHLLDRQNSPLFSHFFNITDNLYDFHSNLSNSSLLPNGDFCLKFPTFSRLPSRVGTLS